MEACSDGHDEIVIDGMCPMCELLEKISKCPTCKRLKESTPDDTENENDRLRMLIYDLETKLVIEKNK